jgi:RNA polymerase sigma factor (sigma-70 family)
VTFVSAVVHIVDDDASFRTSTGRLLRACGYAVETYDSAEQLSKRLPNDARPGCILLDIKMPGVSGPELQDRLKARGLSLPIIFLTGQADIPTTVRVIKAGADDLLTKPVAKDTLLQTIERALARVRMMRDKHEQLDVLRTLVSHLSPRERQVFDRVVRGKMNKEIARELGATERTIKAHRHHVMEKVQAKSLAELVMIAERLGILAGEDRPT